MNRMIPLLSSGVAGSLGVLHLPRLWLKGLLGGSGLLAEGYTDVGPGYDSMVCSTLGLDIDAVRAYLHTAKPSYPEFEKWVVAQPGVKLDAATIAQSNAAVLGYHHKDEVRKEILAAAGVADDGSMLDAVNLNNLDDWTALHKQVVG